MAQHDALLHARWRTAVAARCHCDATAADDALEALLARHREPHRRYHSDVHVARVVDAVDDLARAHAARGVEVDLPTVVLAAAFHDAVYDPTSSTNEADSAELAQRVLADLGADAATIDRVRALVLATASHLDGSTSHVDVDTAVLLDADLSVLGADPGAYQAYVDGVRTEYAHVGDDAWPTGRRHVVDALLAHDPLFLTPEGRERWEARARANLTAERHALVAASD